VSVPPPSAQQLAPEKKGAKPLPPTSKRAQAAAKKAAKKEKDDAAKKVAEEKALDIPADAYVVSLPTFQGPLDLLLHLIQKHELDILDIPVSFVTEKYLAYLDVMRTLSIDVASEYLVMAATLIHIKSKMLLPQLPGGQDEVGEEEEEDPRAELVRRLLDYQKYKAAGDDLSGRDSMLGRDVFGRGSEEIAPPGPAPFQPMGVFNLFDALEKVLKRTNQKVEHNVVFDRISITDRIVELTQKMRARRKMLFEELFDADRSTFEVVITFLAMLEMCKLKLMRVYQADVLASIHVELLVVDDVAEGDELDFAMNDGQSMASGPLPTAPAEAAAPVAAEEDPVEEELSDEDLAEWLTPRGEVVADDDEGPAAPPRPPPLTLEPDLEATEPLASPVSEALVEPAIEEPMLDENAAFEAEFAALLAQEEEAERQAAMAAAAESAADETRPPGAKPGATVDD